MIGWRVVALIALGELEAARRDLAEFFARADRVKVPFWLFAAEQIGSAIALCDGHLDEAEARAERSRELASLLSADASGIHGIQMFSIRREQGRLAELAPVIRILARDDGGAAAWRPGLAALLVELGMDEEARRELARVRAQGLEPFREALWLASLTYLTDACAAVGDEELAALVRARAGAARRNHRVGWPRSRLLRRGGSLPRHARRHPRVTGKSPKCGLRPRWS